MRALGWCTTQRWATRCCLAVQPREQIHRALPRDSRDLVVWLGLRRQRIARQKVFCLAHCIGDGSRQWLVGRAHAHSQTHQSAGRVQVHRRSVSVGLWQNQFGDVGTNDSGLESRNSRRRHLLDEVRRRRPLICDQPRSRFLRRRPRHWLGHQRQRHAHAARQLSVHQHCADCRRRRVVGRSHRHATRARHRLAQQCVDTRDHHARVAPQCALYCTRCAVPIDRTRVARPQRCAHLGNFVWWASPHHRATRDRIIRLGARRIFGLDYGERDNGCCRWRRRQPAV